jgi:23S rRNA (uracil1939-C5)-methyltransferase
MDEKIITIEKVVFGGKGLSRDLEKVTFVPYTLPGEKVRVRITKERTDYNEAEATEIVEPSPDRIPPDCRYFGACGGCQISHATYQRQIAMKEATLRETLERNHIQPPSIEVLTGKPFGYRHRARLKYDARNKRLGFFRHGSHEVIDIHECLCVTPGLNRLVNRLRNLLVAYPALRVTEIECYEDSQGQTAAYFNANLPDELHQELAKETAIHTPDDDRVENLKIKFRGHDFPMDPDIFLQVNPGLWNSLVQEVEGHHENSRDQIAVELYSGAGFFTLPLARKFRKVIAIEENQSAVRFAREHHSASNIEWICARAESFPIPEDASAVIADPPRTGLHRNVVNALLNQPVERFSYVSCDCSYFARDVRTLAPKYRLSQLTLIDLFPQTFHFETVALLVRDS